MNAQLIPKAPRRKRQPTAAVMREQLARAADTIIAERTLCQSCHESLKRAERHQRRRQKAVVRALAASLVLVLIAAASRWAGWLPIGGVS